jgi:hypothetical protein
VDKLIKWLGKLDDGRSDKSSGLAKHPRFVVMFDEAHSLSATLSGANWTIFSELRRVIRKIEEEVFFFFLSTAGKMYQFTPPPGDDTSDRVADGQLGILTPFTRTGFTWFALRLDKDKEKNNEGRLQTDLEAVTSLRWQAHDSRAL